MTTRISVELVPRSVGSIQRDATVIHEEFPTVDTVNVPDLMKFSLRSWDACGVALSVAGERPLQAIPHIRAQDINPKTGLAMVEAIQDAGINEVLLVTGDTPSDFTWPTYDTSVIDAIGRLRAELPDLTIYVGLDPYRQSMIEELDYARRKLDAGATGVFTQPFFDEGLMHAWRAILPDDLPIWWGATTITTETSLAYWRRRNRVVLPTLFEPTLAWNRRFAAKAIEFARTTGDNLYLMPVRVSVRDYVSGLL